jgi:hypothetical protein
MIGYYSTNSDPKAIRRRVRIEATRQDIARLIYSDSYTTSGTPPARRTP